MNEKKSFYPITLLKRCVKSRLLPYPFKIVGGGLLLLLLIALVVDIIVGANEVGGDVTPSSLEPSLWHMAEYAVLHIAIFFMACSREKNEDEIFDYFWDMMEESGCHEHVTHREFVDAVENMTFTKLAEMDLALYEEYKTE